MQVMIDQAGRLLIPKAIRDQLQIAAGDRLELRIRDGVLEIERAALEVDIRPKGPFFVAVPREDVEPMSVEDVERSRRAGLADRAR